MKSGHDSSQTIIFSEDFSLIILRFIMYFAAAMFAVGCAMVLFSIEKSRILPVTLVTGGVCILLILIGEKRLTSAGYTVVDLKKATLRQRLFFFRSRTYDLGLLSYLKIERVISRKQVLLYNIYVKIGGKLFLIGQETDYSVLQGKLRAVRAVVPCPVTESDKQLRQYDSRDVVKLIAIVAFLMMLVYVMKTLGGSAPQLGGNGKFLIVILIPFGYFVLYYIMRKGRNDT